MAGLVLSPEQQFFARSGLRARFFIFTHIGGLMILLTSMKPFFAAHNFPGLIILILSVMYDHGLTASKKAKRLMAYPCLMLGLWVQLNVINHWVMPLEPLSDAARLLALIGSVLVLVGFFSAAREIRIME